VPGPELRLEKQAFCAGSGIMEKEVPLAQGVPPSKLAEMTMGRSPTATGSQSAAHVASVSPASQTPLPQTAGQVPQS